MTHVRPSWAVCGAELACGGELSAWGAAACSLALLCSSAAAGDHADAFGTSSGVDSALSEGSPATTSCRCLSITAFKTILRSNLDFSGYFCRLRVTPLLNWSPLTCSNSVCKDRKEC